MSTTTDIANALANYGLWAEANTDNDTVVLTLPPRAAALVLGLLDDAATHEFEGVRS